MKSLIGTTLGQYEIREKIGQGGMAHVFKAYQPSLDRFVAVKVLPREFLHDENFISRFQREAMTIAGLEHLAIVPVYDFGEYDEQPFLVMQLMPGGSLADRLRAGPLPPGEAARLVRDLATGLAHVHARGVLHRDLKPENVLLDEASTPKLSRCSLAK